MSRKPHVVRLRPDLPDLSPGRGLRGLFVEGVYLLFSSGGSYRKNVNRRLKLLKGQPDRENILVQLRRECGLSSSGGILQVVSPGFYASVWDIPATKQGLFAAGVWMGIGNLIMYRMVNFKI